MRDVIARARARLCATYADMLYQWGLLERQAEVMKCTQRPAAAAAGAARATQVLSFYVRAISSRLRV